MEASITQPDNYKAQQRTLKSPLAREERLHVSKAVKERGVD